MDTKLEKLNKLLEIIKDDTVKPSDIQKFLVVILDVIKKSKENFDNLSSENIKTIKDSILYLEENYKEWEVTQDDKTKSILNGFDAKISTIDALSKELKKSIEEVKAIEIKDGQDADEEVIVAKVLKEIKLPEYKEVILDNGEEIVVKINDINSKEDKYKIDASHIKNLQTTIVQGSNISKSVYQLQDVVLTGLANNDTLKWDSTNNVWVNGVGSGGLSLLTNGNPNSSQSVLNLVQDGSNVILTDYGGGTIGIASVTGAAGADGNLQYASSGVIAAISQTYSDGYSTWFGSQTFNIAKDVSTRTETATFDASNLDTTYTYLLPKANGTLTLSVNGQTPDSAGDITIATGSGTVTSVSFTGGLISVANATTTPALTVAGTSGGIPYFSSSSTWASSSVLAANSLMIGGGAGVAPSTITTGTGVLTALGIAVNGSGAISLTTSPTFVTPVLGVASATSVNKVTITAPATGSTLTIADGKTFTVNNSITLAGTDSTTITMPTASSTVLANNLGISGGSTLIGGTAAGDKLDFRTTSNATNTSALGMFKWYANGAATTAMMQMGENGGPTDIMLHFNQASPSSSNYNFRLGTAGGGINYINAAADLRLLVGAVSYINMISGAGTVSIVKPTTITMTAGTGSQSSSLLITAPAHTNLTASTEYSDVNFNLARTVQFATGALTTQRAVRIQAPTYAFVGASTITDAITLQIDAPTAGTNATITNNYATFINGNWKWGSGVTGIRYQPNTSSSTFAAAYSTNVTPSNTNHFWRHNGVTTVINATSAGNLQLQNDNNTIFTVGSAGVTLADAKNITFNTTTGTKIGTATTEKLSFWNATPIVQPANTVAIDTLLVNTGLQASGGSAAFDTDVKIQTVGKGLYVKEGSNATMGIATLVAGTVVVSTTKVTANSRIFITRQTLGTIAIPVDVSVTARTAATSFTITSADVTDTSTVAWMIVEPA
jgi:hypothetical protein